MANQRPDTAPPTYTNARHVTISSDSPMDNNYRSFQHNQQPSNSSLKITISTEGRQGNKQAEKVTGQNQRQGVKQQQRNEQQRPKEQQLSACDKNNNNQNNSPQSQKPEDTDVCRIKELSSKHLESLRNTFNKIVREKFLSKTDREQHLLIYNQLRNIILEQRPDAQVTLYGSLLFECCLKESSMIDIDVQFNETIPYETLQKLLKIVRNWALCKEAHINIDHEPLSIDVVLVDSNIRLRLTSDNISAIQLSRIIRIYTKFDRRILSLFRLFRFFSKVCHIDQRDVGTVHPVALDVMAIHFLQQLDPPVLPCLHEYVFGIDTAPVALNNDQYIDFFQVCNEYADRWTSKNTTSVEMLFLQLLSYYTRRFSTKRLGISIQTRMPLLRKKNMRAMHSRSVFCADPIFLNKNLCYTLKASRSIDYFYHTFEKALDYFCQTPKHQNRNENLYYAIDDYDEIGLMKQLVETIHKSYILLIERFSNRNDYWKNVQQEDLRQHYKNTFDPVQNPIPQPILKLKEGDIMQLLKDNDDDDDDEVENTEQIEDVSRQDAEAIPNTDHIDDDGQVTISQNEHQSVSKETSAEEDSVSNDKPTSESMGEESVLFKTLAEGLNEKQKTILRKEYDEQVRFFNEKMRQILNGIQSTSMAETCTTKLSLHSRKASTELDSLFDEDEQVKATDAASSTRPSNLFYDLQAKNFGADKGPPAVCSICSQANHMKAKCPQLWMPKLVHIPKMNRQWTDLITHICRQITDECKPRKEDIAIRQEILEYLQNEFGKCYPACRVHIYGSFHNGFGLRYSDLDICIELKDNNGESNVMVLEKLLQTLQSNTDLFRDVEFVRGARVPIIRSIHSLFNIEVDISLNNTLAVENTRLLKTYTEIDSRVSQLGYMLKHLVKICDIGDASTGTLSSYAYIIMLIHFLQQIHPSVLPVLQQLNDDPTNKNNIIRECNKWNIYFYDDLTKLKQVWINNKETNKLTTGELWIEFLRYYIEQFDHENYVVTIRQIELLHRDEKGWFNHTIAIEDPFILTHNLADKLSLTRWTLIRQVFIRAREAFALQPQQWDSQQTDIGSIMGYLFDVDFLCQDNVHKFYRSIKKSKNKKDQKSASSVNKNDNAQPPAKSEKKQQNRQGEQKPQSTHSITTPDVIKQSNTTVQSTPR